MTSVNIIVGHSFHLDTNKNGYGIGVNNKFHGILKKIYKILKRLQLLFHKMIILNI